MTPGPRLPCSTTTYITTPPPTSSPSASNKLLIVKLVESLFSRCPSSLSLQLQLSGRPPLDLPGAGKCITESACVVPHHRKETSVHVPCLPIRPLKPRCALDLLSTSTPAPRALQAQLQRFPSTSLPLLRPACHRDLAQPACRSSFIL